MSDNKLADLAETIRANVGMASDFDFEVVELPDAGAVVRLPFDDGMLRLGGTVSGPVLMTLVDTAMYAAVIGHTANGQFGVTSHLNIEFLRRPEPETLRARANILRMGRRQVSCAVAIEDEREQRLLAYATGAYALFQS